MWGFSNMIAAGFWSSEPWRLMLTRIIVLLGLLVVDLMLVRAEPSSSQEVSGYNENFVSKTFKFLEQKSKPQHRWPEMRFGWKILVGSIVGFLGAALGSVGGLGGGCIFVPMLALIIGFDPKSSAAISKCMVTGVSAATVCYNIRQRHPSLELPLIDYDLALLFQPMLVLGVSIGVDFNVIFADWMVTILLIIFFVAISTKSFLKGVQTWKKETKEVARQLESNGNANDAVDAEPQPEATTNGIETGDKGSEKSKVSLMDNICWQNTGLLIVVWITILALQIAKNYSTTCSIEYWTLNFLQVPVAIGASSYEAVCLYKGRRKIASRGDFVANWKAHKLVIYCSIGVLAGILGGMLGLGGGTILGPLFLEIGIPTQVASATSTFAMLFSASMSVVEYYLLKRFPLPYALYLVAVATIAALAGQYLVGKVIKILGRASIIIFIIAGMVFGSAFLLGGPGIAKMIKNIERNEYMGFDDICSYQPSQH